MVMKISFAIVVFSLIFKFGFSQSDKQVKSFFYDFPFHGSKFEIRKLIHLNKEIFWGVQEIGSISANIKSHPIIKFLKSDIDFPRLIINYNYDGPNNGKSSAKSIDLYYTVEQLNICLSQYNALVNYFEPYAKEIHETWTENKKGEKTGEGYNFYPHSDKSFSFVSVVYTYQELRPPPSWSNSTEYKGSLLSKAYYKLEITVYEDPLKSVEE